MVRVTDYKLRKSQDGKDFYAIILQGGIEFVKSAAGSSYLKTNTVSMPTTFDERTCIGMLDSQLPGSIQKVFTEPYEYMIQETGEVIMLSHRYEYCEDEVPTVEFRKLVNHSADEIEEINAL